MGLNAVLRLVARGAALGLGFALGRALWRWLWRGVGLVALLIWLGIAALICGCSR